LADPSKPAHHEDSGAAAKRSKPTLRTIAEITGLAVTTVSRALSDAPQISIETRKRVREVADQIGYSPDRAAQRLKTGRTNVIGVLLDRLPRRRVAISAAAVAATGYLLVPLLSSDIALLLIFAFIGAASFALYTAALTMLGEEYRGSMLVAGSAAFSLAYAAGSAAGSGATGALMNFIHPVAGPTGVGTVLVIFALAFALAGRR